MSIIQIVALGFLAYVLLLLGLCLLIKNRHAVIEKIKDIFSSREGRLTVLKVLGILILVAALIAGFIFVTKPEVKASLSISIRGLGDKTLSYNLERVTETVSPWREKVQRDGIDKTEYYFQFVGGDENTSVSVAIFYDIWEENGKIKIGIYDPNITLNGKRYGTDTRKTLGLGDSLYLRNKYVMYDLREESVSIDYYAIPYETGNGKENFYVGGYFSMYISNHFASLDWLYPDYADFY